MAQGKQPPTFVIPPAPAKKGATGEKGTFTAFINTHPTLKQYEAAIWQWATSYGGITPTQLAAVILAESSGNPNAVSGAGAKGLVQIFDTKANAVNAAGVPFFRRDLTITDADKANPQFAVRYLAWRLSGYAATHGGTIDQVWIGGYNPRYRPGVDGPANPISRFLPKGYVGTPAQTIDQSAQQSVTRSQVTDSIKDPWVTVTKQGQLKYVFSPTAPANVMTYGGAPVSQSGLQPGAASFTQVWNGNGGYRDQFYAFTGRNATPKEIQTIMASGVSSYTLQNQLAGNLPSPVRTTFDKSPVWKQKAPGLIAAARNILGNSWKPSGGIIRQAIAGGWDQATFEAKLRQSPAYLKGPEFQTNVAQNQAAYEQIYGKADPAAQKFINQTTLQGWSPTELQNWLRAQPAYKATPEYQSKLLSFLGPNGLGLITGHTPVASDAAPSTPDAAGPNSARLPGGQGAIPATDGLVVAGGA